MAEPVNPYAAPAMVQEFAIDAGRVEPLEIATQGKRFLNLIIDNVVLLIVSNGIGYLYGMAYALIRASDGQAITESDLAFVQVTGMVLGWVIAWTYFTFFEVLFQRSLGKFVTGTKVVREDGGVPRFGQIAGRSLARFIPFEPFSFFGGNGKPVGWHDSLSGTRVVKA